MPKVYQTIGNGFITFADPMSPANTLRFANTRSKQGQNGVSVVRNKISLVTPTRMLQPGCDDGCLSIPFDRSVTLSLTNAVPKDETELVALKAELNAFWADVMKAVDASLLSGFLPAISTVFNGQA